MFDNVEITIITVFYEMCEIILNCDLSTLKHGNIDEVGCLAIKHSVYIESFLNQMEVLYTFNFITMAVIDLIQLLV